MVVELEKVVDTLQFKQNTKVAYFTMEIGLESSIPTYSGGLGVLAGDTVKSSADLGIPMVGMTLMYHKGYFVQRIGNKGRQNEEYRRWKPASKMVLLPEEISVRLETWDVKIKPWRYDVKGCTGHVVPVYFLDVDLEENVDWFREAGHSLYGGADWHRLVQEMILGVGGIRMLRALGYESIETNHMNEGHAAFLTLELLREQGWNTRQVKSSCVFTTHTPVPAGHDHFDYSLIHKVITGGELPEHIGHLATYNGDLSLTKLASNLSRYINSVAEKHAEVTKNMEVFKGMDIHHITNGIHGRTWTSKSFQKLFDQYLPGWDLDPDRLACAQEIPDDEILSAHAQEKKRLIDYVNGSLAKQGSIPNFKDDLLTIGFARRATAYKRADLIFSDLERLVSVCDGKVQFVFAGKAHPKDNVGKNLIQNIVQKSKELSGKVNIAYLENYNMDLGAMLTSGVDVWLNNPQRPHEASGTSGMKATHNGVPNYSVLDGWWIEGHEEGVTGWAIGPDPLECDLSADTSKMDVEDLYSKLGNIIIPMFYDDKASWVKVMKNAIAKNASFFNTTRMVKEYKEKAYHL